MNQRVRLITKEIYEQAGEIINVSWPIRCCGSSSTTLRHNLGRIFQMDAVPVICTFPFAIIAIINFGFRHNRHFPLIN